MIIYIHALSNYYASALAPIGATIYPIDEFVSDVEIDITKLEAYASGVIIFKGDFNLIIPFQDYAEITV